MLNVAPLIDLTQTAAAKIIKIPSSTLCKKWKEATKAKKWPYRSYKKAEKKFAVLARNSQVKKVEQMEEAAKKNLDMMVELRQPVYINYQLPKH